MFSLVYVSSAVHLFSPPELVDLLKTSRDNNAALKVSGILLYKDGNFMQVLEGDEMIVRALRARIERDPRHRGFLVLTQGPIGAPQFGVWSMGFRDLQAADAASIAGYSEFLNTPLTGAEFSADPTRCQRLLTTFKKSM